MTLIDLVTAQSARLEQAGVSFGHGTANAFDESAWLVLWALGLSPDTLDAHVKRHVSTQEKTRVENLLTRRIASRLPTAYLTKEAWLQSVPFHVDERTVVPRSLIAELLADKQGAGALDAWLPDPTTRVLDLCTGNASLAVIAALAYPEITLDASDICEDALAVARINIDKHKLGSRITPIHSDLLAKVHGPYDVIVCNPPYVNSNSMAHLPPEYLAEPAIALTGGPDGMDVVRKILREAPAHMSANAVLILEIGHERAHFESAFHRLEVAWLATSAGEDQVLLVTCETLQSWRCQ